MRTDAQTDAVIGTAIEAAVSALEQRLLTALRNSEHQAQARESALLAMGSPRLLRALFREVGRGSVTVPVTTVTPIPLETADVGVFRFYVPAVMPRDTGRYCYLSEGSPPSHIRAWIAALRTTATAVEYQLRLYNADATPRVVDYLVYAFAGLGGNV